MDILKNGSEQAAISLAPIETDMTIDEFCESDLEGYEYVKGELIPMPAASWEHGLIGARVFLRLGLYVQDNQLGEVVTSNTAFQVGNRVLIPDIAFVSTARMPEDLNTAFAIPPDLAVEVVSQTDIQYDLTEKVFLYLNAGTRLVWVIEPMSKTVRVYRSKTDIKLFTRNHTLTGEDVVEGFSCQVAQLFE